MSENFIHIDNITENKAVRPGAVGIGARTRISLDGVSKFTVVGIMSMLLAKLEIDPDLIADWRLAVEEEIVKSERTYIDGNALNALERLRGEKAEDEA